MTRPQKNSARKGIVTIRITIENQFMVARQGSPSYHATLEQAFADAARRLGVDCYAITIITTPRESP